ncbi:MAG: hypothetical protein HGA47_03190 [Zoogloea sp.]|nr:hypothetical protein [Zoogloea sp.]
MTTPAAAAFDEFSDLVLGAKLPAPVESLLARAGALWHQPDEALALLLEARREAPGHPATLIALYRFYFYGHRLAEARAVALDAIAWSASGLGLPADWREVSGIAWRNRVGQLAGGYPALPRFWLFSLKGYAYLSMRLGDLEEGKAALARLHQTDPDNRVGHLLLEGVLARIGHEDDDYLDPPPAAPAGLELA